MKQLWPILIVMLIVSGCAYKGVGSQTWHAQRLAELETAYERGKIDATEYFRLKNETDTIHSEYQRPRYYYPSYHFGYGYRRYH